MKSINWKREAATWKKCADRLAKAVEYYRGEDWKHGGAKSKALTIYRTMMRRRSSPNGTSEPRATGSASKGDVARVGL